MKPSLAINRLRRRTCDTLCSAAT